MKTWIEPLKRMSACEGALEWCESYNSLPDAWTACERGDWMLWLLGKLAGEANSDSRKKLVLTACQCARLALLYVKRGEKRPLKAIETAEKWARGAGAIQKRGWYKQCADIVRQTYDAPSLKRESE